MKDIKLELPNDFDYEKFRDEWEKGLKDALLHGLEIYHTDDKEIRRIDPISDEAKEILYNVKINYLTEKQIKEKYNISLTYPYLMKQNQKIILQILKEHQGNLIVEKDIEKFIQQLDR